MFLIVALSVYACQQKRERPTEALDTARLTALRGIGQPELALTARRAETLKARAYDGDLARIAVPEDADTRWLLAVADPADDLRVPMKGPLHSRREGDAALHRLALSLAKSAQLLPAAVLVPVSPADSHYLPGNKRCSVISLTSRS